MAALSGFHHVKLPVSDLARTRDWYERVLGFVVDIEFVEEGVVTGLALTAPDRTVAVALRHDPARAAALSGFDVVSLRVPTREGVKEWRARLDELGERHGALMTGHRGGTVLVGVRDPDGIEIRLYAD
jgi:catechol 2,3-dioxygenase-like lactoylglutathione lyase family enzyme